MEKPHISFKADPLFNLFGLPITNSLITGFLVTLIFLFIGLYYQSQLQLSISKRGRLFFLINFINKSIYEFFESILGESIVKHFPLMGAFFLYILVQNWFGLLPGIGSLLINVSNHEESHFIPIFRATTADLNTTIMLALVSVILTNYYSIKTLGIKAYIGRFYRLKDPMSYFLGTLEIVSEISKVISFSFRLFGNIFAGEVLLTVIAFLVPIFATFPFLLLELFVGFIQALVFSSLTAVFISVAVHKHS